MISLTCFLFLKINVLRSCIPLRVLKNNHKIMINFAIQTKIFTAYHKHTCLIHFDILLLTPNSLMENLTSTLSSLYLPPG